MGYKLYIENGEDIPAIIIQPDASEAPANSTEGTTVTNFFKYGIANGLTKNQVLEYSISLIADWATHDQAEKDLIIAFIESNQFTASVTTEIRDSISAPYLGFKIFNTTYGSSEWWKGVKWASIEENIIMLSSGTNGIYAHSNTSMTQLAFNVCVPSINSVNPNATKVFAKIVADYETDGDSTGAADLFCYTDYIAVANSEYNIPNQLWRVVESPDWIEVTEKKTYRLRTKRVGGVGSDDINVEGFTLMLKYV